MDLEQIEETGFTMVEALFSLDQVRDWIPPLEEFRKVAGGRHSVRNLAQVPLVQEISLLKPVSEIVQAVLGDSTSLIRAILFDKIEGANWSVPWHQDLTIAVAEKHDIEGYGPWSVKEGVVHVRPPSKILENMITVRIHLDECGMGNGPVRVIPGSHLHGIIPEAEIEAYLAGEVYCTGGVGSALVMRPLILHASSPASVPSHRRVLHLEFAGCSLARPLRWHETGH